MPEVAGKVRRDLNLPTLRYLILLCITMKHRFRAILTGKRKGKGSPSREGPKDVNENDKIDSQPQPSRISRFFSRQYRSFQDANQNPDLTVTVVPSESALQTVQATSVRSHSHVPADSTSQLQRETLWDQAWSAFYDQEPELGDAFLQVIGIDVEPSSTKVQFNYNTVKQSTMERIVKEGLEHMQRDQWKFNFAGGSVILRDQIDRILGAISATANTSLVSSVAALDPVHAGLPLVGLCTILKVRRAEVSVFSWMTDELIKHSFCRPTKTSEMP